MEDGTTRAILPPVIFSKALPFDLRALSILIAALLFAIPCESKPAARDAQRATPAEFDALPLVRSRQNHLLVRAFINGKSAWLGVDTGAPVSAIAVHRRGLRH